MLQSTLVKAETLQFYAGVSYLKMKDYANAIDYLGKFTSDDLLLEAEAKSLIGDAFADINQLDDALTYYEEAANSAMTPLYLMKAGQTAMMVGKYDKAEALFTELKEDYPNSDLAVNIDMYINKAKYSN